MGPAVDKGASHEAAGVKSINIISKTAPIKKNKPVMQVCFLITFRSDILYLYLGLWLIVCMHISKQQNVCRAWFTWPIPSDVFCTQMSLGFFLIRSLPISAELLTTECWIVIGNRSRYQPKPRLVKDQQKTLPSKKTWIFLERKWMILIEQPHGQSYRLANYQRPSFFLYPFLRWAGFLNY